MANTIGVCDMRVPCDCYTADLRKGVHPVFACDSVPTDKAIQIAQLEVQSELLRIEIKAAQERLAMNQSTEKLMRALINALTAQAPK